MVCQILDVSNITSLISSLGFPIVMCLVLAWYIKYLTNKNNEVIQTIMEKHKEESQDFKTAIDNNTKAIEALTAKVERLENKA